MEIIMNSEQEKFNSMLGINWYEQHRELVEYCNKYFKKLKPEEIKRFLATLMTLNELKMLKDIGLQYINGYKGFPKSISYSYAWVDHPFIIKDKKTNDKIFVTEPYGIGLKSMKEIIYLCEKHNYNCQIGGLPIGSIHFPNSTISIRFDKKTINNERNN